MNEEGVYEMASVKFYLKIYSLSLGFVVSFASFCWIALILYVLSQTDPGSTGLMLARYLDISFGLLAFTSSLALLYGAFVESKVRSDRAKFIVSNVLLAKLRRVM